MHPLEIEVQTILDAAARGDISEDEKKYLLMEIRDIKAANECAHDERVFRVVVQACNVAMGLL
jgi:uncharacterized protein (DUF433 family)